MIVEEKTTGTLGWAEEMAKKTDYACFAKEEPGNKINWADAGAFFLEGYKEAMRWRDPINDPPKCNDLMQIKYGDIFSNTIDYGHDRYLEDMGMWDIEQLANIKVLAWRPIK